MLYLAALVVTLTSLVCGQDYKAEHLGLHKLQNPYYNIGPWQTVDVVGAAGGCCLPPEMEALTGFVLAEVDKGRPSIILGQVRAAVSSALRMTFSDMNLAIDGNNVHLQVWQNFTKGTQYTLNMESGKCMGSPLEPWKPMCVPADSKYLGNVYFGNQSGKNNINGSWYQVSNNKGYVGFLSVTETGKQNECVPLTETIWGIAKDVPFSITMDYMDIIPKVEDPRVFVVPSKCTAKDVPEIAEQEVMRSFFFR